MALVAQAAWIKLAAGPDLYLQEVVSRGLNEMKRELSGASPSPAEALLVERVCAAWLQLHYIETREAQHHETNIRWAEFQLRRQAQAERQLRSAINDLAALRKAQRTITVEVRQPPLMSPAEPIIAGPVHGEQPATEDGQTGRRTLVNGSAMLINRLNGVNGHQHRIGDSLERATVG